MRKITLFLPILIFTACAVKLALPLQADADRVSAKYPGYTLAQLSEGKSLFENKCSTCHGLKKPTKLDEAQWAHEVPDMARKAERKAGKVVITKDEQELILKYLVTMGSELRKK